MWPLCQEGDRLGKFRISGNRSKGIGLEFCRRHFEKHSSHSQPGREEHSGPGGAKLWTQAHVLFAGDCPSLPETVAGQKPHHAFHPSYLFSVFRHLQDLQLIIRFSPGPLAL